MMKVNLRVAVVAASALVALAACSPVADDTAEASGGDGEAMEFDVPERPTNDVVQEIADLVPDDIRDRGVIQVAMTIGMAPLNYPDEGSSDLVGFNPDIAEQLGELMDMDVEIHGVSLDQILPGIEAGRYDMAVSNMAITDERLQVLDFVEYYFSSSYMGVRTGNPDEISLDDPCGISIGVGNGSFQQTDVMPGLSQACEEAGEEPLDVQSFPDQQTAALALSSARLDAVAMDGPVLLYAADRDPNIEPLDRITEGSNVGIGVAKDTGLLEPVHAAVAELMENGNYGVTLENYGMTELGLDGTEVHQG